MGANFHLQNSSSTNLKNELNKNVGKKRRDKSYLGPDFIAPDGGWGWLVCAAAGISNLCSFALLQQFGLLFRDRLHLLGMPNKEITTIINLQACVTSCMGLLNGPMFRLFSYRQVAFCSAVLFSIGVFSTSFSNSFTTYVITFSVLYGVGSGINASANSLALNTYFKEKRRIATGCSWTLTALGPIIFPQIIALLLPYYGVQGTVMIFSGIALNAVAMSMLYHPVMRHVRPPIANEECQTTKSDQKCAYCQLAARKNQSIFSSQYLYNSDSHSIAGYEIIDPGTPMMSRSNDGWYSSRRSNYSSRPSLASTLQNSRIASSQNLVMSNRPSYVNLPALNKEPKKESAPVPSAPSNRTEKREKRKEFSQRVKIDEAPSEDCDSHKAPHDVGENRSLKFQLSSDAPKTNKDAEKLGTPKLTINAPDELPNSKNEKREDWEQKALLDQERASSVENNWKPQTDNLETPHRKISTNSFQSERELLNGVSKKLEQYAQIEPVKKDTTWLCTCEEDRKLWKMETEQQIQIENDSMEKLPFLQKILIFFDLDLLKDFTYVNLMIGVTIAGFAELNYSILTPFVLSDYGFTKREIATVMSLLGAMDISVRFFVPFIAGKIGWDNKTFFLVGIMGMALGRISIAHFHSYYAVLITSCWIGLNKGLRTVFMALVIPTYVPLDRLPGASGLQLVFAGIFYFLVGPVVGWIRDATNYTVTLHCLNVATYVTCICWTMESYYRSRMEKKKLQSL